MKRRSTRRPKRAYNLPTIYLSGAIVPLTLPPPGAQTQGSPIKGPKVEEPNIPETKSLILQRSNNDETPEKARKEKKDR